MKEIYLIRHSAPFIELENYVDYKNVLWDDYNRNMILSIEGEKNAQKLCDIEELNGVDSIYSSDSFRAIGTAKYLAEKNNLKVKLDSRINERRLGCKNIIELPDNFSYKSFTDKNLKFNDGESLNDVNERFNDFLEEILNNDDSKIVLVIHGMLLMSYLQQICDFKFDGSIFEIKFKDNLVINRKLKNPDIFKIIVEDRSIKSISNLS